LLPGDAERDPAGDEEANARALRQQLRQTRPDGKNLLEVVEQEQHVVIAECARDRGERGPVSVEPETERPGDRRQYELRVADGCERHVDDTVREQVLESAREVKRQAGLADAAGAGDGEEPGLAVEQ
jgi:hypothetical protein